MPANVLSERAPKARPAARLPRRPRQVWLHEPPPGPARPPPPRRPAAPPGERPRNRTPSEPTCPPARREARPGGTDARLLPHPGRRGRGDGGGALPGPPQPPRPERPPCAGALAAAPSWLFAALPLGDRALRAQESSSATERPGTRPPKGGGGGGAGRGEASRARPPVLSSQCEVRPAAGAFPGPVLSPDTVTESLQVLLTPLLPGRELSVPRTDPGCDGRPAPAGEQNWGLRGVVVGPKPPGWDVDSQS